MNDDLLDDEDEPPSLEDRLDDIDSRLTDIQRTLGYVVWGITVSAVLLVILLLDR